MIVSFPDNTQCMKQYLLISALEVLQNVASKDNDLDADYACYLELKDILPGTLICCDWLI